MTLVLHVSSFSMLIFEGMLCFLRTPVVMSNCNLFAFYSCAKDGVRVDQGGN